MSSEFAYQNEKCFDKKMCATVSKNRDNLYAKLIFTIWIVPLEIVSLINNLAFLFGQQIDATHIRLGAKFNRCGFSSHKKQF